MNGFGSQGDASIATGSLAALGAAIEATAGSSPDRVALVDDAGSRTYGELAQLLGGAGRSGAGGRRALAVGRSVADVETILSESFAGAGLLLVDTGATAWEVERAEALFVEAGGADPEGVAEPMLGLCSSGSSGLPKVVELGWESLLLNAGSFAAAAGYGEADVLWCTTPLAHLYCFGAGVLGGLLSGATVLLGKGMLEPHELAQPAAGQQPTLLLSVPFLFRRYLRMLEEEPEIAREWRLRGAIAAGEPVTPELIAAWRRATGVGLRSHYGLTEGGQITLADGGEDEGVGRPLDGVEVRIGAGGEISVRRPPPGRPYRIVGGEPDADGWYETGDLGHLDEGGNLHVTGRADSRINVAGKKVDPAEVEDALDACEGVEDCAVAGVEGSEGVEVVAFVRVDGSVGDGEIRAQLATRLSPHKLPRRFVRVEEIPRTLTGKLRRGELIAGLAAAPSGGAGPGDSMLELVRAEAAAVVLGNRSAAAIEPTRSFKELGFDSLAAVSLCERLAQASGLRVQATAVFDHPTPAALAAHIEALAGGTGERPRAARAAAFLGEPIAIVGMACRYPGGVDSPQRLWELLAAGGHGISGFPEDRGWDLERLYDPDPGHLGTSYTRHGGFLADADRFDAEFFGISPREALAMDPQQRLLLEGAWEALEDAGIDPERCRETAVAVFAGVMTRDYGDGSLPESTEGYLTTGLAESVVSGRVAYSLGLEGPAVTVNTACSSSLVAMHLACQSLRLDECSLALAGGVSVMATPAQFIEFSRQRGLAADGRCKSFAAAADGTGWSEGLGVLALERLSDARRNGHRVLATIRGSAINQDGASNGLTAPNGPSQERVIRQALANARLEPGEVDAVEAHGTGTALGDPIEAGALLATYGQDREAPLRLGSIKSNIGHTLAAAGVAGVIKVVQAMRNDVLPKTLHVDRPSPHVDWEAGEVELLTEAVPWESKGRPRRAGVSSFGISGTNAHLILEEAPAEAPADLLGQSGDRDPGAPRLEPIPWPLAAKGEEALAAQAERLRSHLLENPELDPLDVGFTLATARSQLSHRAVLLGSDRAGLLSSLGALAGGERSAAAIVAEARSGKSAFLFTGQGAQRAGMGEELHGRFPAFAEALDALCAELDLHMEQPLRALLFSAPGSAEAQLLDRTQFTQPALFAVEVALYRLLESWGMRPDFVAGHSIGELSAAHVAGVLSLPDACELVAARGRLMGELDEGGAMVAIGAPEEVVRESIAGLEERLSIAAVNDSGSTVVSGEEDAVLDLTEHFKREGHRTARLRVSHAFHSPRMQPMLGQLTRVAEGLAFAAPEIPIVSNLSGELLSAEQAASAEYWARQAREPVRFRDGVRFLAAQGTTHFLELGPDGILSAMVAECLEDEDGPVVAIPVLRKDRPEAEALLSALASAHAHGLDVEWAKLFAGSAAKRVDLPTYAFQRKRYWIEASSGAGDPSAAGQDPLDHPLLSAAVELAEADRWLFTGQLSQRSHPWLAEHALAGAVLLPGTAYLELALAAARELGLEEIEELTQEAPILVPESGAVQIQLTVGEPEERGRRALAIHSRRAGSEAEWARNASGAIGPRLDPEPQADLGAWPPAGAEPLASEALYDELLAAGFEYGPLFQGLGAAWRRGEEIFAEVELGEADGEGFAVHPALLDAALHASFLADPGAAARVPFSWSGVSLDRAASALRVRLAPAGPDGFSVLGVDGAGAAVISVKKLALRALDPSALRDAARSQHDSLFRVLWQELSPPEHDGEGEPGIELWHCEPESGSDPAGAAAATLERALARLQDWLSRDGGEEPSRLALITKGAIAVEAGESPDLAAAPLWGLVRSAQSEHPGRLLLIDSDGAEASGQALGAALALEGEPQLAIREGRVLAPRLESVGAELSEPPRAADPASTTLITGGTGTLGALLAHHLIEEHGARHLILASRRGAAAPGAEELATELEELGAEVELAACDAADRAQLGALIASVPAERPLKRVIHAAGVLDDGVLEALTPERLVAVLGPKANAAWNLHELTRDLELDELVLFSSVAATLGGPGQANYAAANAFLDALAAHRQAEGLPGSAIAWGLWASESAMSGHLTEADLARMRRSGLAPLADRQGLELFDSATGLGEPLLVATPIETATLRAQARSGAMPAIFGGLVRAPARRASTGASLAAQLAAMSGAEREARVLELVRGEAAAVLGHSSAAAIDPERAFKDLGFDSLAAVELRNRLGSTTGLRLPATAIFDHPSVRTLTSYLCGMVGDPTRGAGPTRRHAVADGEPIAIVGMACRYPGGVTSPQQLWDLVAAGGDAISGFPEDRGWDLERLYDPDPDRPGTSYAREGGFIADAADFDAEFFDISPREALAMDSQQRLLLEACWQSLESAGIDPASLRGTQAGVFAGIMYHDYGSGAAPRAELEGYVGIGVSGSVASGRVAYQLGLEGPAITLDTACSSSLVAMHLACRALSGGECDFALAGGATVISTPGVFTDFSRQRGLAPDGRCKAFAEGADGVGWSEGVGVLALERLSEARAKGHPVYAVIKGSAVNQDGASNGLTAPNGPSQERVIRQALANASLEPKDVDAVEAHGTGTALGDPIEAGALLATYGQDREAPLRLGSIKSNIGHTQAAAGVAGVIKVVQAMRNGVLPRTLHVDRPSPQVDWSAGRVELLEEPVPWQPNGRPRRAGVSSFGISGTNAHLILEEAPAEEGPSPADPAWQSGDRDPSAPRLDPIPWPLAAKSEEALRAQAERLHAHLIESPELDPLDVGLTLATARSQLSHRAVLLGSDREGLLASLAGLADRSGDAGLATGIAHADRRPVFLFPGQGSQWPGMAQLLIEGSAAFATQVEACEEALSPFVDWSLGEVLRDEGGAWLDRLDIVQPALFAVMVSLARLWQRMGVEPTAVVGHSQGEIAAAHLAGGLSLADAARVVTLRSRAMSRIAGEGGMLSVSLPPPELVGPLEPFGERVSVAALNGPASVVLSGDPEALAELQATWEKEGVRAQRIAVDYAAHSGQIEALREELLEAFAPIAPRSGEIPFHSTVLGGPIDTAELDAEYWYRNLRETVLLEPVLRSLLEQGHGAFLEISPHPVLGFGLQETIDGVTGAEGVVSLDSLRREEGGIERFTAALASAHAHGLDVDWGALFAGAGAKRVELPTYAFQRKRYWIEPSGGAGDVSAAGQDPIDHPLLSAAVQDAGGERWLFTGQLSQSAQPWLAEHAVSGTVLLPGTAYLDLALTVGRELGAEMVEELTQEAPIVVPESGAVQIQLGVGEPDQRGRRSLDLHSRAAEPEAEWVRNASGTLAPQSAPEPAGDLAAWPPPGAKPLDTDSLYDELLAAGFEYGPTFQGLRAAWRQGEEIFAEVELGEEGQGRTEGFAIHPALLDAALHANFLASPEAEASVPFSWSDVSLQGTATSLRVRLSPAGTDGFSLLGCDGAGRPLISIAKLALRPLDPSALRSADRSARDCLFRTVWQELPPAERDEEPAGVELWHCEPEPGPDPASAARATAEQALLKLQDWLAREEGEQPSRLALITRAALAVEAGESPDLAAAPLWGLLRSAQAEHPDRLLLIDSDDSEPSRQALEGALALPEEPQLAIREGRVLAPRLGRVDRAAPDGPWHLDVSESGTLENLALLPAPRAGAPLGPSEVRIAVHAGGLNFRDVLIALGSYPDQAPIGSEGAGVVVEVGAEVRDFGPGDRVFGFIPDAFGPLAVAERSGLAPIPPGWSFAEGATVPIAALTAFYGLFDLALLQAGEKVLIHAAAGGVGDFAVQLAHHAGAEVFATAHPDKWEALRSLGIAEDHIASSRDLGFREKFLAVTGGEGVDVVLNSLAHEFVDASLDLLPRGGRFAEMGKADRRDPERIAASQPGVAYRAYDLIEAGPERIEAMLGEVVELFERGALAHPAIATRDVRRGAEAFRFMSQGRHVGKIVFRVPQPPDPNSTTLITGGTGTLGTLLARHLVNERGARHLILAGRRGAEAPGARELAAELGELGAEVELAACDVADPKQLAELIASVPAEHPLASVYHAAGVLDDGVLAALTPERLQAVLRPKVDAAWHLHELTRELDLSEFVLFSSIAATLGGPGQANYAAANGFLDALAARRQAEGLPGSAIAWGLWASESAMTGHLAEADLARMRRSGMAPISDEQGLALLDAAAELADSQLVATPIEAAALHAQARSGTLPAIFAGLVRAPARREGAGQDLLAQRLSQAPEPRREEIVLELVRGQAADVLGYSSAGALAPERPFKELGFDSLAAVELRNRLGPIAGVKLPATTVFDYPSPGELARYLLSRMEETAPSRSPLSAHLDGIERGLASVGEDERMQVRGQLQALLTRLSLDSDTPERQGEKGLEDLESVSDDEVIKLIDDELGLA